MGAFLRFLVPLSFSHLVSASMHFNLALWVLRKDCFMSRPLWGGFTMRYMAQDAGVCLFTEINVLFPPTRKLFQVPILIVLIKAMFAP